MTKKECHDLLCSLPKEVLIAVIENTMFRPNKTMILGQHWNFLAKKAQEIREKAIEMGKNRRYHEPEYQEHLRLWNQAERIDHQADKIYLELEKSYE